MSDKFFVGFDITGFENNGKTRPISRVTLMVDDNNAITAGDDTGSELVADCPFATQEMVNTILANVKGYEYQMYAGDDAAIDPSFELGDGVTVGGIYSVISKVDDDGSGYATLSAPGEEELEDEYPASGPMTQEFNRQIADTRSTITKTAEEIRLEVENELEGISSSFTVELNKITARIDDAEGSIEVAITTLDGLTVTDGSGTTKIKGSSIETETLYVTAANITGTLTANQINLTGAITWGDLATDSKNQITSAQDAASTAYTIASNANNTANAIGNTVSAWTYQGSTYIDGSKIMTGTVMASKLLGGIVGLLASDQTVVGSLDIANTTTGIGLGISTNYGGLQINAAGGNVYVKSYGGAFLQLGYGGADTPSPYPICQLGGGPLVISAGSYGTVLPSTGVQGQVFFLLG